MKRGFLTKTLLIVLIVLVCVGIARLSVGLYDDWKDSQVSSPTEAKGIWGLEYD